MACGLFGSPLRPDFCAVFAPEPDICGSHREEALALITLLDRESL